MTDPPKYFRWHPAIGDATGTMRGDDMSALNAGTFALIHEQALLDNKYYISSAVVRTDDSATGRTP